MKKLVLIIAVMVGAMIWANAASADTMTFSLTGNGLSASGTFYGVPAGSGQWLVTGATGTFNGSAITTIETLTNSGNVFAFNNIYYWPGPAVDLYGIVFDLANGDRVNLCYDSGCFGSAGVYTAIVWDPNVGLAGLNAETYSFGAPTTGEVPVPEPGTLAFVGTGLVGVAGVLRRKLKS
jgi:hypothetical protein